MKFIYIVIIIGIIGIISWYVFLYSGNYIEIRKVGDRYNIKWYHQTNQSIAEIETHRPVKEKLKQFMDEGSLNYIQYLKGMI